MADMADGLDFDGARALLRGKYQDDPVQLGASLDALDAQYTGAKVAAATRAILRQAALDAAIDGFGAALRKGIATPDDGEALVEQIGAPGFDSDPEARSDAYLALRNHVDALAAGAARGGLGAQFGSLLGATADGAAIAKAKQLKILAQGGLTPEGYGALSAIGADPAEARLLNAKVASARAQLSIGPGDAEGEAIFTDHFLPTFVTLYQMNRAQGKQALDLLDPESKDDIGGPLISIFGGMRERIAADSATNPQPPNVPLAGSTAALPALKLLHPDATYETDPRATKSLDYWQRQSTESIIESLRPQDQNPNSLKVKPDGTVIDGNTRLKVLQGRGVKIDGLPREPYPPVALGGGGTLFYDE